MTASCERKDSYSFSTKYTTLMASQSYKSYMLDDLEMSKEEIREKRRNERLGKTRTGKIGQFLHWLADSRLRKEIADVNAYSVRVEFATGRGQMHLHILSIARNKVYIWDFYRAKTEQEKNDVVEKYAKRMLDPTADTNVDENHKKLDKKSKKILSPLGVQFGGYTAEDKDCRQATPSTIVNQASTAHSAHHSPFIDRSASFIHGDQHANASSSVDRSSSVFAPTVTDFSPTYLSSPI